MNCEKFDQYLMDALFEELDEVNRAGMKRHAESCARCSSLEAGMRATLEVGTLPLEEPSSGLEERILLAAKAAQRRAPWHRKLIQAISWAGSHAMRPQLAMAAVLVLMVGSSILLLRARPGSVAVTPVKVTEQGTPHTGTELGAGPAATAVAVAGEPLLPPEGAGPARAAGSARDGAQSEAAPAGVVAGNGQGTSEAEQGKAGATGAAAEPGDGEQFERAMSNYRSGRFGEAQRDFADVNRRGGQNAASAAFYEARAVRSQSGCRSALPYYSAVRERFASSSVAADAAFEQADCHRILGETAQADQLLRELESNPAYRDRVATELANRGQVATAGRPASAQAHNAAASAAKAAKGAPARSSDTNVNQGKKASNVAANEEPAPQKPAPPPQQQPPPPQAPSQAPPQQQQPQQQAPPQQQRQAPPNSAY